MKQAVAGVVAELDVAPDKFQYVLHLPHLPSARVCALGPAAKCLRPLTSP